jgi:hypothetical protein
MITMLWKELRENVKWAVLALIGLAMAEFYALNQQQFFGFYVQEAAPLCKSSFLMITTFGCGAVGAVLGLIQFLPEQRRDQWAALIHRPVPRATIFRGKAVAGLFLYFLATTLPFIACVWYVATPGHFAVPFSPGMILPGVGDICAGAMYYLAALFVALHRGAWYGTRAFGFLAAVMASFFVMSNQLFYVVIEATVLMGLALFTAAWGAMLTNGTFRGQPWIARFAVLAVVFYGVCAVGRMADMTWSAFSGPNYYFGDEYIVDIDGRPLKMTMRKDGSRTYADLAGHPVVDERLFKGVSDRNVIQFLYLTSTVGDDHEATRLFFYGSPGYRGSENYLASVYAYESVSDENWFYLPHERILVGFNPYNRTRIGAFGADGFVPDHQPVRPFSSPLIGSQYGQISTFGRVGNQAIYIDYGQRTITTLFQGQQIFAAQQVSGYTRDPAMQNIVAVVLLDKILLLDNKGKVFATLPFHYDMDRWGALQIGVKSAKDPIFVMYSPSGWLPPEVSGKMPSYLEAVDLNGNVVKNYVLPHLSQHNEPRSWQQYITENLQTPTYYIGEMVYDRIGAMLGVKHLVKKDAEWRGPRQGEVRDHVPRILILSLVLGAVALGWARRRQFSWGEAWRWAGFTFLFNLAGLLTFRLVADWPVCIKCPACGRPRRVDQSTCPHCAVAWPVPAVDGTEIIDEPAAPVAVP